MSTNAKSANANDKNKTAEQVREYLQSHPDFFEDNADLLETLHVQHHNSGTISLIEKQVKVLRSKNTELQDKLSELILNAGKNEQLMTRLHRLAIALMETETINEIISTSCEQLRTAFNTDLVSIKLFKSDYLVEDSLHFAESTPIMEHFGEEYYEGTAICGKFNDKVETQLFGNDKAHIKSSAVVPLIDSAPLGYIALGSFDEAQFATGKGTLILDYLGELLSQAIKVKL